MVVINVVKFASPVKCHHCVYTFTNSCALSQHMESEHESECHEEQKIEIVSEEIVEKKEPTNPTVKDAQGCRTEKETKPEEVIHVKYELDSVHNLKKAKHNLSRSTEIKCVPIDDENIKF